MLPTNQSLLNRINVGEMTALVGESKYSKACKLYDTFDSTTQSLEETGRLVIEARNGLKQMITGKWHGCADRDKSKWIYVWITSRSTNHFDGQIRYYPHNGIILGGAYDGQQFSGVADFSCTTVQQ